MHDATIVTIVERAISELYNNGKIGVVDELYAPDYQHHDPAAPDVRDREAFKTAVMTDRAAFHDFQVVAHHFMITPDLVTVRWTVDGTHRNVWHGIPPTGRHVTLSGLTMYRITHGQIQETWWGYDRFALLQHLGVIALPMDATA